jgi:hypothetical protein
MLRTAPLRWMAETVYFHKKRGRAAGPATHAE